MKSQKSIYLFIFLTLLISQSCETFELELDNPIDTIANEEADIFPPALTLYPLTIEASVNEQFTVSLFIVKPDTTLAGIHARLYYDVSNMVPDTITPGILFTNDGVVTPLFTNDISEGQIDINVFYLGDQFSYVDQTGHVADIYFSALTASTSDITIDSTESELVTPADQVIPLKGVRGSTVIIQ